MKLAVNIDPILQAAKSNAAIPTLFAVAHELSQAGVAMLDASQTGEWEGDSKRDWKLVYENIPIGWNIHTLPVREAVERALQFHPERITFVKFSAKNQALSLTPDDRSFDWSEVVKLVREHGVDPYLRIDPALDAIKRAAKLHFAGLEFDSALLSSLKGAVLTEAVSKWNENAVAAWKLGLGVWTSAKIRTDILSSLHTIREIEGISVQEEFWAQATLIGIERTVTGIRHAMA